MNSAPKAKKIDLDEVLDYEIGNRGIKTAKKLFTRLAGNYKINNFATYHWSVYHQAIPKDPTGGVAKRILQVRCIHKV